ncbi:MAG: helix-turn-helix domain-containing protein [Actinomycetota bacterium]|nr:helix-turn-helix domain-containing protein [Actinomycetota bacterium]
MTSPGARPRCPDCGAQLRRGRGAGQRCDPCQRTGPRIILPEAFYDQPPLQAALAGFDFGVVFRRIRATQQWSQQTLAEFLGMEQARISDIENGKRHLLDLRVVVRVANQLAIPAGKLGFAHGTTVGNAGMDRRKRVSWVHRRDFVQHVAGLTLGAGMVGLDIDRLISLLPHAEPTGTRHVGAADVEAIEQVTIAFVRQDFAHGSGLARDASVAQLHAVLPLLNAQVTSEVRPRLLVATADLALVAGWMSFDVNQHDAARRLWLIGLNIARAAEDHRGADLTAFLLYDMALQAVHLGRLDEALRLVHLGHAAAAGPHPVSASTRCCLAKIQARAHAAQGDATDCDRALGQAVEQFSIVDPASCPPWGSFHDEALLAAQQGAAHYTLALVSRDSQAAGRAVSLLRQAVNGFGPDRARTQALYLSDLAGAHALAGDTDTAVSVGHQAVDAVTALHSPRTYDRLRVLNTALKPLHTSAGVAELRDRLSVTAA